MSYVSERLDLAESRSLEKSSSPVMKLLMRMLLPFPFLDTLPQSSFFRHKGMIRLFNMVLTADSTSPSSASTVPKNTSCEKCV